MPASGRESAEDHELIDTARALVPLTDLAVTAIRDQMEVAGNREYLFSREGRAVGDCC